MRITKNCNYFQAKNSEIFSSILRKIPIPPKQMAKNLGLPLGTWYKILENKLHCPADKIPLLIKIYPPLSKFFKRPKANEIFKDILLSIDINEGQLTEKTVGAFSVNSPGGNHITNKEMLEIKNIATAVIKNTTELLKEIKQENETLSR